MKAQILQVDASANKKSGEMQYAMTILSQFLSFGQVRPATAQVKLDSDSYEKYKQHEGKEVDLNIIMPLPDYPLRLK